MLRREVGVGARFGSPKVNEDDSIGNDTGKDAEKHPEIVQPQTFRRVLFINPALVTIVSCEEGGRAAN